MPEEKTESTEASKESTATETQDLSPESLGDIFSFEPVAEKIAAPVKTEEAKPSSQEDNKQSSEKASQETEKAKEETKSDETKPEETKTEIDWDSDINPYKGRLKDTRDWATQVNQENQELRGFNAKLDVIGKKVDGTYDEEAEKANTPTADQIRASAEQQGRINASKASAEQQFGVEVVADTLAKFHEKYGENTVVQDVIMGSQTPVLDAMKLINKEAGDQLFSKYGPDPESQIAAIQKEAIAKEEKSADERADKRLSERLTKKNSEVQGLSDVKDATKPEGEEKPVIEPLARIFS